MTSPHPDTIKIIDGGMDTQSEGWEEFPWLLRPHVYYAIPIFGYFIDIMFPVQVPEELDSILNQLIIVNALMLGVAGSIISGVDFQEFQDALSRWSTRGNATWSFCWPPEKLDSMTEGARTYCSRVLETNWYASAYCVWQGSHNEGECNDWMIGQGAIGEINAEFAKDFTDCVFALSASLMLCVALYLALAATSFKDSNHTYARGVVAVCCPLRRFSNYLYRLGGLECVCVHDRANADEASAHVLRNKWAAVTIRERGRDGVLGPAALGAGAPDVPPAAVVDVPFGSCLNRLRSRGCVQSERAL